VDKDVRLIVIFLYASREELLARVSGRKGHYMGANMVNSQYELMEVPGQDEPLCLALKTDGLDPQSIVTEALRMIESMK
jgi:gluconokinase